MNDTPELRAWLAVGAALLTAFTGWWVRVGRKLLQKRREKMRRSEESIRRGSEVLEKIQEALRKFEETGAQIANIAEVVHRLEAVQTVSFESDEFAHMITDAKGEVTKAYGLYSNWTGLSTDHFLKDGWLTAVWWEDRERVRREWECAVEEQRIFAMDYRLTDFHTRPFQPIPVRSMAQPIRNQQTGKLYGWIRRVVRLDRESGIQGTLNALGSRMQSLEHLMERLRVAGQ